MSRRSFQLINWSLYAILDKASLQGRSVSDVAEELIAGGAGIIQLRDKLSSAAEFYEDAARIREITRKQDVPLIINDRVDIALTVDADGVHLGQSDLPLPEARACLGRHAIIGASVHNQAEFQTAISEKADYLGVGTMFRTPTKPELQSTGPAFLRPLRSQTDLPLIAIGGINLQNVASVFAAGADGVALISALLDAPDIQAQTAAFVEHITQVRDKTKYEYSEQPT